MDQTPSAPSPSEDAGQLNTSNPPDDSNSDSNIAGFWPRCFAFSVDTALLIVTGSVLGFLATPVFASMGLWGRAIGIAVVLIYFGVGDSTVGGGASPGKRLAGLRVVDRSGNFVSVPMALTRSLVFVIPVMLDARCLSCPAEVEIALGALVFGGGGAMIALYLTNRQTRQSIHDLVARTFVIKAKTPLPPVYRSVWWGHYMIAALVAIAITSAIAVATMEQVASGKRAEMAHVQNVLKAKDIVSSTHVLAGDVLVSGKPIGFIQLTIKLGARPSDGLENEAIRLTAIAMQEVPEAFEVHKVGVRISYGYDIGIAVKYDTFDAELTPDAWRQRARRL